MRIGEAKNERELIGALETARQRRLNLRRGMELRWWNNIALVAGDHYARWDPVMSRYEDRDPMFEDISGKKPRMVINHALTVARTELSKLTKSQPIMEIIANSDEQADIAATKVGRAALDYAEWKFRLKKQRKQALWWMIQTGLGAMYVGWDYLNDQSGHFELYTDPATGEPVFEGSERFKQLQEMLKTGELDEGDFKKQAYPLGDLEYKLYSPFQLLPDETALEWDKIRDLITTEVADVDVLKGIYGKDARDLTPDENVQLGVMEQRMLSIAGVPGSVGQTQDQKVDNACHVHTYWLEPGVYRGNKLLENGIYVRWTSNRKALDISKGFPFQDSRIPFVFFEHIPASSTIWPDCVMNHIRGPNLEIDKTVSQLIDNKDYMANPMWLIATQHKLKGEVRNVAGGIVRYRHVPNIPPPTPVQGMQMPQQVESLLIGLRQQILDISGQSEVARGNVPSGVRSGVAVAYLQEEDDTKIAPTVDNMEESIAVLGSMTLERFSQFYNFERIIRFYRRDGIFDVRKFKGADLKNNTDVICQAGSAMPRSKAARQQFVLELISLGVLKDPHKIEQELELGQGEPDDTDKAISQANRENNLMMHGSSMGTFKLDNTMSDEDFKAVSATAVPVKKWHNHAVHISRHTSVMMDEEFDSLAISHPEIVRLFDEHLAMHQQMLDQQQQQQMQALMAAKGAPDGPPGQSGGAAPGAATDPATVIAGTAQPDPIGGGSLQLRTRNRVHPGA
jgi:hypothetical protein